MRRAARVTPGGLAVLMVGLAPSLAAQAPGVTAQLDSARRAALALARPEVALRRGYHRIAPRKLTDLNPLVGEHWINESFNRTRSLDLARPAYLMYFPLPGPDSLTLVGVGYTIAQPAGSPAPTGFAGADDQWHVHLPCGQVPVLQGVLTESVADCQAVGGTPAEWQIAMVHVWSVPNPDGPFAQFHPGLPFLATGMAPPTRPELEDPDRAGLLRRLGLALGETFGGVPRLGARISQNPDSAFANQVRPQRDRIRSLLPSLRAARSSGDDSAFVSLAADAVEAWGEIRDAYLAAATTPAHRQMLERWFSAAIAGHHRTQLHPH